MPFTASPGGDVVVIINEAAVRHMLGSEGGMSGQFLFRKLNVVRNLAIGYCPVRTGRLRSSIQIEMYPVGSYVVEGTVGTDVEYAYWVHEGRGPVYPIRARVLHWVAPDGTEVFAPKAGPATGQPFLQRAMDAAGVA